MVRVLQAKSVDEETVSHSYRTVWWTFPKPSMPSNDYEYRGSNASGS